MATTRIIEALANPVGPACLSYLLELPLNEAIDFMYKNCLNFCLFISRPNVTDGELNLFIQVIITKCCAASTSQKLRRIQEELILIFTTEHFLQRLFQYTTNLMGSFQFRLNQITPKPFCSPISTLENLYIYYSYILHLKKTEMPWEFMANINSADSLMCCIGSYLQSQGIYNSRVMSECLVSFQRLLPTMQQLRWDLAAWKEQKIVIENERILQTGSDLNSPSSSSTCSPRSFNVTNVIGAVAVAGTSCNSSNRPGPSKKPVALQKETLTANENFRRIQEVPTRRELLLAKVPTLNPMPKIGSHSSPLRYLEDQYRLLREDFVAPLREVFNKMIRLKGSKFQRTNLGKCGNDVRFYDRIEIYPTAESLSQPSREQSCTTLKFNSPILKKEEWIENNWLLPESLLILSSDDFKTIYIATVQSQSRNEEELSQGILTINWHGPQPTILPGQIFTIAESETYFAPYRHTLKALQIMAQPDPLNNNQPLFVTYPMAKYIVNMSSNPIPPPKYLLNSKELLDLKVLMKDNTDSSLNSKVNPMDFATWPQSNDIGMDKSQFNAFQSVINQELSIIQGLPGTGKTFISLQLIKLFLSNSQLFPVPILIVSSTDHALDQFLEGVLSVFEQLKIKTKDNLIRIGGASDSKLLSDHILQQRSILNDLDNWNYDVSESTNDDNDNSSILHGDEDSIDEENTFDCSQESSQNNLIAEERLKLGQYRKYGKVIGMTTTNAAKYKKWLQFMKPKIVIVEEAAEILESHVVTSITEDCEHLILIGDHKQLKKPEIVTQRLAKDYHFDVSLFERLINNKFSSSCLEIQHRMRPEICSLLVPTIYEKLENHSDVLTYPKVDGFHKDVFFIDHQVCEDEVVSKQISKTNTYEAKWLLNICRYLIHQNYTPSKITILVTYKGQKLIVEELLKLEEGPFSAVAVETVDSYEGKENDIIILSLVRSNFNNDLGFLKIENRIRVALSRARHGLYIIGNMTSLVASKSKMWTQINKELLRQKSIGRKLQLKCQNHGNYSYIETPEDFQLKATDGGCDLPCKQVLDQCKHSCPKSCHIFDPDHLEVKCQVLVPRLMENCGHDIMIKCYKSITEDFEDDLIDYQCESICAKKLKCGHTCKDKCHQDTLSPDHDDYKCEEQCIRKCKQNHSCVGDHLCLEECNPCEVLVAKISTCGHLIQNVPCFVDMTPLNDLKICVVCKELRNSNTINNCVQKKFETKAELIEQIQIVSKEPSPSLKEAIVEIFDSVQFGFNIMLRYFKTVTDN